MKFEKKYLGFAGVAIVNFFSMLIMCGVGVYGYMAVSEFGRPELLAFTITLETAARCAMIPFSGILSEKAGRKNIFTIAVLAYIIAYMFAVKSTTVTGFLIARTVTGLAWGLFVTNSLVLMKDIFSAEEMQIYSGYLQTVSTIAMALGAPVAGVMCSISWRLEFYVFLPLMGFGLILSLIGIPKADTMEDKKGSENSDSIRTCFQKLKQYPGYIWMLVFIFLFNIGNASGNYLAAFVQSELGQNTIVSSLVSTPGVVMAIIVASQVTKKLTKEGCYKKVIKIWSVTSLLGFGIWYLCMPQFMNWQLCYLALLTGFLISGIATGISQICPYIYPMDHLPESLLSFSVSLVGFFGTFGAMSANAICGIIQSSALGLTGVLRMALIPSVCMVIIGKKCKECI